MISKPPSRRFHLCRPFLLCRRNDPCHIFHISHCRRRSPRGRYTQSAKCVKVMLSYKNKILSHFFHSPLIATFPVFATFFTCSAFSADSAAFAANPTIHCRIYGHVTPLYLSEQIVGEPWFKRDQTKKNGPTHVRRSVPLSSLSGRRGYSVLSSSTACSGVAASFCSVAAGSACSVVASACAACAALAASMASRR